MEDSRFLDRIRGVFIDRELLPFAREIYESLMLGDAKANGKKVGAVNCNPEWPICYQMLQKNKVEQLDN